MNYKQLETATTTTTTTTTIKEIKTIVLDIVLDELVKQNKRSNIDFSYLLYNLDIDLNDISNIEEDIYTELENNQAFDIEIIYYNNAIDYLKENDSSLKESLEIAAEYNYTLENLSSETLASLLASKKERDNFSIDLSSLIEDIEELNI